MNGISKQKRTTNEDHEEPAQWVDVDSIHPWEDNPKPITEVDIERMKVSIERFGWADVITAREEDGEIIGGHLRHEAAIRLGMSKVPVRFLPLSQPEARALSVAVTRHEELRRFDDSIGLVLRGLEEDGADITGLGWSDEELAEIISSAIVDQLEEENEEDIPEPQAKVHSVLGEVYELGPHRLVCGDSTTSESWDSLLCGEKVRMVWTDPPYGVDIVGCSGVGSKETPASIRRKLGGQTIINDKTRDDLSMFLSDVFGLAVAYCRSGSAWYVSAPSMGEWFNVFGLVLLDLEIWKHTLVWLKNSFVLGQSDYHYRHEPIFYGWVPGSAHYFTNDRTQDTVHQCDRPSASKEHPTMKPVSLIRRHIENSSKSGWLVADPFGGSGSTLIACAESGRVARLIELDPKYCDVIRRRWTRYAKKNNLELGSGSLGDE